MGEEKNNNLGCGCLIAWGVMVMIAFAIGENADLDSGFYVITFIILLVSFILLCIVMKNTK